jgi:hypothetical protein
VRAVEDGFGQADRDESDFFFLRDAGPSEPQTVCDMLDASSSV